MALDTATISALAEELSDRLSDGRIEKIQQPEKDLLLLTVRSEGENRKLLIRAAGPNARVHLTEQSFENPKEAPMFCMLLRKYLTGARVKSVEQPNFDRLIAFRLESRNELGDSAELSLITELMGRAANVVLVGTDGRILDCLRRIPLSEHGTRALLPGLRYELPPVPEGFGRKQEECSAETEASPAKPLPESDRGSISELLDRRYGAMERQELQKRRAQELVKSVRRARDRQQRKLAAQAEELRRTEKLEDTRRQAELLQANLYRVRRGDRVLECENYYEEDSPLVTIPLDLMKTPQENLNARFKEYRKLKGAKEHLTKLIAEGEKQLEYLNSVLDELSRALSAFTLVTVRSARKQGMLSDTAGAAEKRTVMISSFVWTVLCLIFWAVTGGWLSLLCALAALVCTLVYRRMACRQFGGVTGDLAGWFLQVTELALTAAIVIGGKLI